MTFRQPVGGQIAGRWMLGASLLGLAAVLAGMLVVTGTMLSRGSWDMGIEMGTGGHMSRMLGGGRDASGDTARQGSANETVQIQDFSYAPGNLQVPVGARVTWVNRDSAPHSATAKDGSWDTDMLRQGESASITFDTLRVYQYFCSVHPDMKARVAVQ